MPSSASPRANSTTPVLSDTDSSARRTRTSPGWVIASIEPLKIPGDDIYGLPPTRTRRGCDGSGRTVPLAISRTAPVNSSCSIGRSASRTSAGLDGLRQLDRLLEDDRPGVDPLVHEVDGDAEDLDAVVERLLDRAHARERGQQRRMDVDDPQREGGEERRAEQLHVAREHHELDALDRPATSPSRGRAPRGRRTRRRGTCRWRSRPRARGRAPARRACPSRRPRRRPRGRGRCRGSPAGSSRRPTRGRRRAAGGSCASCRLRA